MYFHCQIVKTVEDLRQDLWERNAFLLLVLILHLLVVHEMNSSVLDDRLPLIRERHYDHV